MLVCGAAMSNSHWRQAPPALGTPRARTAIRCALIAAILLSLGAPAQAAFSLNDTSWEGTSELLELSRHKLGRDRVRLVATLDYSELTPSDGVLVLAPRVDLDY